MTALRGLPSVEQLLQTRQAAELIAANGRPLTLEAIRSVLAEVRTLASGQNTVPDREGILIARERLLAWTATSLIPVINASGVVLHTNLGRAPLSKAALHAIQTTAGGYSSLEIDLDTGTRGNRAAHVEQQLKLLTRAESALVVNNNAAGVLLVLSALAHRKRVIISRSQLVEIGGGFRVPDVMKQSGAVLKEIGTTNRVHLEDYAKALEEPAAGIMRVHSSNFKIIGFASEPPLDEISALAHDKGVFVIDDIGSGVFLDTARFGLAHEPTVQESLAGGADVICFSGDKLLGGPQAGIILGKEELLAKIKKHPLARAVRADKLCLSALNATILHYLKDEAEREIPIWQMIGLTPAQIQSRAQHWAAALAYGEIVPGLSTVGGGSLPGETLPTYLLRLRVKQPNQFINRLRRNSPPVIARIEEDCVMIDPRTVLPDQEGALLVCLQNALGRSAPLNLPKGYS